MEEYKFLLDIAIILAMTKSFSLVSKKFNMPPVVGALIAGIILGPVVLNVVSPSDSVLNLAEVGVVVLMFQAGLETDIEFPHSSLRYVEYRSHLSWELFYPLYMEIISWNRSLLE